MKTIASIISAISNPLPVSIPISFALVYRASGDFYFSLHWMMISAFFAFVVGFFVLIGVKIGLFNDFDISKREQRPPIFLFAGFISILYLFTIILLNGPIILLLSSGGLLLGIVLESIINRKIKASVHMAVYSAFAVILSILYGGYYWSFLLFIPVVAWSRVKLGRHVIEETIIGSFLGVSLVMFVYLVIKYIYS